MDFEYKTKILILTVMIIRFNKLYICFHSLFCYIARSHSFIFYMFNFINIFIILDLRLRFLNFHFFIKTSRTTLSMWFFMLIAFSILFKQFYKNNLFGRESLNWKFDNFEKMKIDEVFAWLQSVYWIDIRLILDWFEYALNLFNNWWHHKNIDHFI